MTVVYPAPTGFIAMCCASIPQYGVLRSRGGTLETRFSFGMHCDDYRIRARLRLYGQQGFAISIRIIRMGINSDQEGGFVTIGPDRIVQRRAVFTWFIQKQDLIISRCEAPDDFERSVRATSVGDDDFHVYTIGFAQQRVDHPLDMLLFIAARDDHQNRRRG